MSPEEALTLIIKARYRADFNLLKKVAFAPPHALASVLSGTPYARVFEVEHTNTAQREVEIERNIYRFVFATAERVFLSGSLGFQNVAAYLILKQLEARDLVVVTEAVRYAYDRSKIALLLSRPLGKVN
jgi:vacuolar-type H+-ATPase subunit C/Vma6